MSPPAHGLYLQQDHADEADVPTTWEGLCNENLKGKIAYCSPSKSGSAYTQLCTMLFSQPTIEEGWDLVGKFIANLTASCRTPPATATSWLLPVSTLWA